MKCQQDYTLILKKKGLILLSDSLDCTISTILKFLFTLFFLHGINGDFIFTLPAPFCGSFVSLNVRDVVKEYRFPDNIKTFLVFQVLLLHVFGYSNAVGENENVLPAFLMYLFVFYCIFMFLISIL